MGEVDGLIHHELQYIQCDGEDDDDDDGENNDVLALVEGKPLAYHNHKPRCHSETPITLVRHSETPITLARQHPRLIRGKRRDIASCDGLVHTSNCTCISHYYVS